MNLSPESIQSREQWSAVWFAMGLVAAVTMAAAASLVGAGRLASVSLALVIAVVWTLLGYVRPPLARRGVRGWVRVARGVGRRGSRLVLAVMFYAVVVPAGRTGAGEVRAALEGEGGWRAWDARPGASDAFTGWLRARGHAWAVFLVPFIGLLRALGARPEGDAPDSIYTLF